MSEQFLGELFEQLSVLIIPEGDVIVKASPRGFLRLSQRLPLTLSLHGVAVVGVMEPR